MFDRNGLKKKKKEICFIVIFSTFRVQFSKVKIETRDCIVKTNHMSDMYSIHYIHPSIF